MSGQQVPVCATRSVQVTLGALAAAGVMAMTGSAWAQSFAGRPGAHVTGVEVEPQVVVGYGFDRGPGYTDGFGFGLRLGIPLMANGPITSINDSLALSVGADLVYWNGSYNQNTFWGTSELLIPVMLQWNFYLTRVFSIFPEAGVALGIGGCSDCGFYAAPGFALGARIHLDGRAGYPALVARIGFPAGLTLGVAF